MARAEGPGSKISREEYESDSIGEELAPDVGEVPRFKIHEAGLLL
jgi:hypothetical protein